MSAEQLVARLTRWWWIVIAGPIVALVIGAVWLGMRSESFESEGSYVVGISASRIADLVRANEALGSNDEILTTYAHVARSDAVVDAARDALGLSGQDGPEVQVSSTVVPGANVLLISARSRDPQTAFAMAAAVGAQTQVFVSRLNDVFVVRALDGPTLPVDPTGSGVPGLFLFNVTVAGLLVGAGASVVAERRWPERRREHLGQIIDRRSSAFTKRYLVLRLREELSRARSGEHTFCLGVLRLVHPGPDDEEEPALLDDEELTAVARSIESTLRDHDVLAHLGRGRFAAILPNVGLAEARVMVDGWRRVTAVSLQRGVDDRTLTISVGVCQYDSMFCLGDLEAERVATEL